jgi:peroxiredoxin
MLKMKSSLTMNRALMTVAWAMLSVGCGGAASSPAESAGDAGGNTRAESGTASSGSGQTASDNQAAASHLPDFELETLEGDTVALSDHLGKDVILIDFWATFCDPCLVAMPHLSALYDKYEGDGFVVLGVSIDGPDSMARVRSEVRKAGVTFPILLDPETEALALYNPKTSAPYSVLISRDGHVIKKKEGFTPTDVPTLEEAVKAALAQ